MGVRATEEGTAWVLQARRLIVGRNFIRSGRDKSLEIADPAEKVLTASRAREPTPDDVLSGAVTGQMMHADQVERCDVERLNDRDAGQKNAVIYGRLL